MEENFIKDIPTIVVPNDLFNSNNFQIEPNMFAEQAKPEPSLGYTDELNTSKNKITPMAQKWEMGIKFYISDFELIDIFRNPKYAYQRYNEPVIKYRWKWDRDESKGCYPVFSRAFFKLWEVLGSSNVLDQFKGKPLTVANVAEGPGGFIHCLIDFRKKQHGMDWNKDSYHGITLKVEMKEGQALDWDWQRAKDYFTYVKQDHKVVLSYGADGTGNMLKLENLDHYMKNDLKDQKCDLVTGDGGIGLADDEEYSKQEIANGTLFFAEIMYALHVQANDGVFILKIYDIYYNVTLQLILLLSLFYRKVTITKPHTSRPASSEKYLICEGFKGITPEQLELIRKLLEQWVGDAFVFNFETQKFASSIINFDLVESRLEEFKKVLAEFNKTLSDSQISKINRGLEIASMPDITPEEVQKIKQRQKDIAIAWCKAYNIPYREDLPLTTQGRRGSKSRSRERERIKKPFEDPEAEEKMKQRAQRFGADISHQKGLDEKYPGSRDSKYRNRSRSKDRDRGNVTERHGADIKEFEDKLKERSKKFGFDSSRDRDSRDDRGYDRNDRSDRKYNHSRRDSGRRSRSRSPDSRRRSYRSDNRYDDNRYDRRDSRNERYDKKRT